MTVQPDKLSIKEVEELINTEPDTGEYQDIPALRQLLDTMRENERLRETLIIIYTQAMNVMRDDVPPYGAILKCGWVHKKCKEALNCLNKTSAMPKTKVWPNGMVEVLQSYSPHSGDVLSVNLKTAPSKT